VNKPTMRSSSTPMFMTCNPSVLNPDNLPVVEVENETAMVGTLVHGLAESLVKTGSMELAPLKQRLSEEDYERAGMMVRNFLDVWREAALFIQQPQTELALSAELSHVHLTGTIDVCHIGAKAAYILDYKTGRQHEDHYHQMAAYAFLVWDRAGRPQRYTVLVTTVYLEDKSLTPYTFTPSDLEAWEQEVAKKVLDTRYTAGRKCAFCRLQDSCPAYRVYGTNALKMLADFPENDYASLPSWQSLSPEDRGSIVDQMYVVEKAIDRVKLSLRNTVKSKGRVAVGPKMEYVLVEEEHKQIDTRKALPILLKRIGKQGIDGVSRLPLDEVLTAYAARAAKGQKTKARKELFEELDAAGAVVRAKSTKMFAGRLAKRF
jgi:RecB family exonuclease